MDWRPLHGRLLREKSAGGSKRAGNRHIETIADLADWLLEKHLVATVPGTAFGDSNCIRFSFAASDADIETGLGRLAAGLAELE